MSLCARGSLRPGRRLLLLLRIAGKITKVRAVGSAPQLATLPSRHSQLKPLVYRFRVEYKVQEPLLQRQLLEEISTINSIRTRCILIQELKFPRLTRVLPRSREFDSVSRETFSNCQKLTNNLSRTQV